VNLPKINGLVTRHLRFDRMESDQAATLLIVVVFLVVVVIVFWHWR
jgi:hypothetical protein